MRRPARGSRRPVAAEFNCERARGDRRLNCQPPNPALPPTVESDAMSQHFGWLKHGDKPEPRFERIATLWRMKGTSGRNIEYAAFRTETGIELPARVVTSWQFLGNRAAVSERAKSIRSRRATRGHHDWRRYAAHVTTHGTQPNDRERVRRLHGDGDQRALLDAHARAVHPSSRRTEGCGPRPTGRGHKRKTASDRLPKKSLNC